MNFSIRLLIYLFVAWLIALALVITAVEWRSQLATQATTKEVEISNEISSNAFQMVLLVNEIEGQMPAWMETQWAILDERMLESLSKAESIEGISRQSIAIIETARGNLQQTMDKLQSDVSREGTTIAFDLIKAADQTRRIIDASENIEATALQHLRHLENRKNVIFIWISIVLLVWVSVGLLLVRRVITKPVQNLVNELKEGNSVTEAGGLTKVGIEEFDKIIEGFNANTKKVLALTVSRDQLTSEVNAKNEALDQLKETQENLIRSEKLSAIGTMVGSVAHEVNNPLMGIKGYLGYLSRNAEGKSAKIIEKCSVQVDRIERIVKNLLIFSRQTTQTTPDVEIENCDPVNAVETVIEILDPVIHTHHATVNIIGKEHSNRVQMGCDAMTQVLLNLLKNAVEATDKESGKGLVQVEFLESDGLMQTIAIRDNGYGIPKDIRESLFKPFFTTKPPEKGTGLGLPVVQQLCEAAGGTVFLNTIYHDGAEFRIQLPIGDDEQE